MLNAPFQNIVILGDNKVVPDSNLIEFKNKKTSVSRLYGDNYYSANKAINDWCLEQQSYCPKNVILISVWQPADALTIGPFASETTRRIMLVDPKDLDCLSLIVDELESESSNTEKLTFIGGNNCFSDNDKELLLKALTKTKKTDADSQ